MPVTDPTPDARPTPPTLEEIVFARDFTCSCEFDNEYARCPLHSLLERFRDAIQSGDYAILSRADREEAIHAAVMCGTNQMSAAFHDPDGCELSEAADLCRATARALLQLQEPT